MSPDMGILDDPLAINMLGNTKLKNTNFEEEDSDAASGPEDWSKLGAWSDSFVKHFMDLSDFSLPTMPMDTDLAMGVGIDYSYVSTMGIDPASLHFNPAAAGLSLGFGYDPSPFAGAYAALAGGAAVAPPSSGSSASSTPPPSTPPSASHSPLNVLPTSSSVGSLPSTTVAPPLATIPRPKTSHTTIERRYRTNLNARIQSLRMAVPALRVLEDRDGSNGKKIKKNIKGGVVVKGGGIGVECSEDGSVVDVIDERGFVDGVKVARKCSKANVLGKAVEYIRVLKRRERRLKAELAGVKVLVEGLVGGPALIREWEKQWRAKFGGEEKDEIEGEDDDAEGDDDDSDDEDGDDGDEEGAARKRKRPRISSSNSGSSVKKADGKKKSAPPPLPPASGDQSANPVPEKRKRGRPRKILPPPVTLEPVGNTSIPALLPAAVIVPKDPPGMMIPSGVIKQDEFMQPSPPETPPTQWQQPQQSPQRYLLAVFALFSFFNSPLTSSGMGHANSHHHHTGKVLTPPLVYSPEIVSQFVQPPTVVAGSPTPIWKEYVQLFHLVVSFLVLASFVGNWFGFGVSGFRFRFEKRGLGKGGKDRKGKEGWIKYVEERVLKGEAGLLSHWEQFMVYRAISERSQKAEVGSLVGAAIALNSAGGVLFGGLARIKARKIWEDAERIVQNANNGKKVRVTEELVFESMDLDAACERLTLGGGMAGEASDGEHALSPVEVLASDVVRERVRSHLGRMFVELVEGSEDEDDSEEEEGDDEKGKVEEERRRRETVDASREVGGIVEEMGKLFERMWKIGVGSCVGGVEMGDVERLFSTIPNTGLDEEIRSLFIALVLYARLFSHNTPSRSSEESDTETETERGLSSSTDTVIGSASNSSWTLLSPPPSPGPTPTSRAVAGTTNTNARVLNSSSKTKHLRRARMMLELRAVLECRVFEGCITVHGVDDTKGVDGLEEARDRVVDLIVEFERRAREYT